MCVSSEHDGVPSNTGLCTGPEKPHRSLLMAADTVKWSIDPEQSCDKQGVGHVGGQLRGDRQEDGGGVQQISLCGVIEGRVVQVSACTQSSGSGRVDYMR